MKASQYGHHEVVKLLIEAGADVNIGDKWGLRADSRKSREILE